MHSHLNKITNIRHGMLAVLCSTGVVQHSYSATDDTTVTLMPYAAQYNYSSASTPTLNLMGLYGYIGQGQHALELEYDHFSTQQTNPVERNMLGIYTYYSTPATRFRVGYHGIDVDNGTDAKIGLAGVEWDKYNTFGYKVYGLGLNYYASEYQHTDASSFQVHQLSPAANVYLSNPEAYPGYFNISLINNIVYSNAWIGDKKTHYDVGLTAEYVLNQWTLGVSGNRGDAAYGIHNKGFVVLNSADKNLSTLGASLKYQFTPATALHVNYEHHQIENLSSAERSHYDKAFVGVSHRF